MSFDVLILGVVGPEATEDLYLKTEAILSYPEEFFRVFSQMQCKVEIAMRFDASLQVETGDYLKIIPLLEREVLPYVKLEVAFPPASEKYIKARASFAFEGERYLKAFAMFAINAEYLKLRAALTRTPILDDLGNDPPEGKTGLLSRHYLSVFSVKKEV
jgi:hypothetical protein